MSKPTNTEMKPKDDEPKQSGGAPQIGINQMLIMNTVLVILALLVCSIVIDVRTKSTIKSEIQKMQTEDEVAMDEGEEEVANEKGILLDLGDFILNLADTQTKRYLKVNVALELSKTEEEIQALEAPAQPSGGHGAAPADPMAAIVAEMDQYKPAIRDAVISVLSSKTADELASTTGKEVSKEEIQDLVGSIFNGTREVLRVNFAQFIIQ